MKFKLFSALSVILFMVVLQTFLGCSRAAPTLAPTIPPQMIWSNGSVGIWFNNALTANTGGCNTTGSTVAVTDPISGDTNTLRLTATGACGFYYFSATADANPFVYYSTGHLQFDIRLEQPPANITSMNIQYLNYLVTGNYAEYNFPVSFINSLSTSSFTHVSLPFTSFTAATTGGNGYYQNSVDTPFQISWSATGSGTAMTVDDVVWTSN